MSIWFLLISQVAYSAFLEKPTKLRLRPSPISTNIPRLYFVHRLDFGTSGLMVVARNKAINAALSQQFSQRSIIKIYQALLCGHLANDEGVIDAAIAKTLHSFPHVALRGEWQTCPLPLSSNRASVSPCRKWDIVTCNPCPINP